MRKILSLSILLFANINMAFAQNDSAFLNEQPYQETLEVTPDLLELVVEMDKKSQGFLASHHQYEIRLDVDFLVNGRMTFSPQFTINKFLAVTVPVSFECSCLGQGLGSLIKVQDSKIANKLGGLGLKIRLTEWMLKSSFYLEPTIQVGYIKQSWQLGADDAPLKVKSLVRLIPALYLGFEQIFDGGFVVGAKLGAEWRQDFVQQNNVGVSDKSVPFVVVPMLTAGYAW